MTKEDRIEIFEDFMRDGGFTHDDSKKAIEWLDSIDFFTAPASTKYHGAYEGGLFDHSWSVAKTLVQLTDLLGLPWERPSSPYIVGMFHDLCKCDNYIEVGEEDGKPIYEYNNRTLLKGHGDKSVMILSQNMTLTEEEIACITYHMGAFTDKEKWTDYTNAVHKYANVLYTHTADMVVAHIYGV